MSRKRVFISVANREHADLRDTLDGLLSRAGFDVVVQPDFPHTVADTVRKLDDLIAPCDLVVHVVGRNPGSRAAPVAVGDFFTRTARTEFLAHLPDASARVGDCAALTYAQWEPWLALHRKIDVLVYGVAGHDGKDFPQRAHLDALYLARKHAETFPDDAAGCGRVVADVCVHFGIVPGDRVKLAPSRIRRHAPDRLFGREQWLDELDRAWTDPGVNVLALVAWGGVGKTALVAHWVSTRFHSGALTDVERYFDWSFYSQGTGESRQSSADVFIQTALTFFDDPDPLKGGAWERGERLAELVRKHRTLLVLDGVEPLQYPLNDPQAGRFKDPGLEALLQGLAADNHGLCVVTTREHLTNVDSLPAVREHKLDTLLRDAAVSLLRHLQLVGTEEQMTEAFEAAGGHALTLRLLGRLIARAYGKDVRRWREVKFEEADRLAQGRSSMRVMRKYEEWLKSASVAEQLELAILRLTGLFDRPMSPDCFQALCAAPPIPHLTEQLVAARPPLLEAALDSLVSNDLLSHGGDEPGARVGLHADRPLDAHPLIREYFAIQLRKERPEAFKAAHSRLFDHLCATTPNRPDTLDGLQPLYQAVVHGCHAGRYEEARADVYRDRILRGTGIRGFFSIRQLGAIGADLAAVAAFFDEPWSRVTATLPTGIQAWVQGQAAFYLRALGRLTEAGSPMRACLEIGVRQQDWKAASNSASNLCDIGMALGQLAAAEDDARQSVAFADRSGDSFWQMASRTAVADTLHQCGRRSEAGDYFREAERRQGEQEPEYNRLYSLPGFQYCDWLLAPVERAAWETVLGRTLAGAEQGEHAAKCDEVHSRGTTTLRWVTDARLSLLDIGLDHLTLSRVGLYQVLLAGPPVQPVPDLPHVATALTILRRTNNSTHLPRGLLTAALYHFVRGEHDRAHAYLDETQQLAERGPMPLFLADVHLHRARMFRDTAELKKAATLIHKLGYGRRYDELEDAAQALGVELPPRPAP